jgi:hypothetical protein
VECSRRDTPCPVLVNVITVLARDAAGNTGRTQLSIRATDTRAPVVTILRQRGRRRPREPFNSRERRATTSGWPACRGVMAAAAAEWRQGPRAGSRRSIPVQPGSNDITVTATDKAGNSADERSQDQQQQGEGPGPRRPP